MSVTAYWPGVVGRATLISFLLLAAAAAQAFDTREGSVPASVQDPVVASPQDALAERARSQLASGNLAEALESYRELEFTQTGAARSASRDALWQSLNALPDTTDFSGVTEPFGRGWVELMQLARRGAALAAFEDWRSRYPDHPGESQIAAGLVASTTAQAASGRKIALLLPLSGPLAAAATAIQAGAQAARLRAGAEAPDVVAIDASYVESAITDAIAGGASALIGPLLKEDVAALSDQSPPLPTVTLNYLDAGRQAPSGLITFGLAPEDEARAAADHAASSGLLRAVLLAQQGDWGERTAAAFKTQFESRGGTVLLQESYAANAVDFSAQLKRLLGITYSEARGKRLSTAGIKAEMQPVPRGDIDLVFLSTRSAQAKMIWPQMRYLRAGRIPTYATASAADGGTQDLGNLNICDAPWRIETRGEIAELRTALAAVNPKTADAQRLFALGYDAYGLARRAVTGTPPPSEPISGLTGTLILQTDNSVRRQLTCVPLYAPASNEEPRLGE